MVWDGFCAKGTTQLAILDGSQDSSKYMYTLSEYLLRLIDLNTAEIAFFNTMERLVTLQGETKTFFSEQNISVMEGPAKSPDLNPTENIWGILVRVVYRNGIALATVYVLS